MKNNFGLKVVFIILAIIWSLFVIIGYFAEISLHSNSKTGPRGFRGLELKLRPSHQYYFDAIGKNIVSRNEKTNQLELSPIIYVLIFFICFYALYVIFKNHRNKAKLSINSPPVVFFILFSILFFVTYFALVAFYKVGPNISFFLFFKNYCIRALEIGALVTIVISVGKQIYESIYKEAQSDGLSLFLFSFGLGTVAITFLTFILGIFGQINQKSILILFIVLIFLCVKNIIFWAKKFLIQKVKVESSYFSPQVLLVFLIAIFASFNFLNLSRPIPIGHDELEAYMNTSNLLASNGKLLSGLLSYPWELFVSSVLAGFKSINLALIFSSLSGLLVAGIIYKIVKTYCENRDIEPGYFPVFGAALFFTLPTVVFQLSQDIKMDLPAMFFAGLSLISFWQWQNEIRDRRRLFLAAFFAGFAFLIKATLIFFALALVFYIILVLVRLKISLKKSAVLCVFCIIFFLLPLVPFGIKNSIEAIHQSKSEFATSTFIYGSEGKPIISLNQAEEESAKKNSNIITSSIAAELNRYGNFKNGLSKYIFFPIISTLNSAASGQYVDAGFIFLLFVPLLVLAYPFMARKSDRRHFVFYEMALTGIVYWLLWATFSHGVIWYGFTGFLFLLMLLVEFLNQIKNYKNKFFYLAICVILVFWFSINLLQRTAQMQEYNIYVNKDNLIYAGGKMSDSEYYHRYVSSFAGIVDFINSEIDKNKENPPRVYLIGKYIKFFIKENDKTVYQDNSLSVYMAISDGKTDSSVIDRLKQNNINYIVVEKYSISFFGDSADTLRSKLEKLETTIRNNPDKVKVLYDDKGTGILFAKIL